MALARSSSGGAEAISRGTASTSAGRTRGRSSNPATVRWPDDISAPERVVGTAHTLPPRADAIALATSITRPPPHATSLGLPTSPASSAATSGTAPAGTYLIAPA